MNDIEYLEQSLKRMELVYKGTVAQIATNPEMLGKLAAEGKTIADVTEEAIPAMLTQRLARILIEDVLSKKKESSPSSVRS